MKFRRTDCGNKRNSSDNIKRNYQLRTAQLFTLASESYLDFTFRMGWAKKLRTKARKELRKARNMLANCFGGAGNNKVCEQAFGIAVQLGPE
jgi:hypothetical protein